MGKFVFIEYTGDDSAIALARILGMHHDEEQEPEEVTSETRRLVGFQSNPVIPDAEIPDKEQEEGETDDDDDEEQHPN